MTALLRPGILSLCLTAVLVGLLASTGVRADPPSAKKPTAVPAAGPLRVHPKNPRYFTDGSGRAVYLTGSHVWGNLQDYGYSAGYTSPPPVFDYTAYLDLLQRHHHNFIRLWRWEAPHATVEKLPSVDHYYSVPMAYQRPGPGRAADGGLKFDVGKFNQDFFDRLRERVKAAGERGIYVSVMMFQGWNVFRFGKGHEAWLYHPFQRDNNVNGVDGDPDGDGQGEAVHSLRIPAITRLQEAYVRQVIDTVNDLDNVLYEISNETQPTEITTVNTKEWEYAMVRYIQKYESVKPKQHPVGVTSNSRRQTDVLDSSPSEWVSLRRSNAEYDADVLYRENPPASDGRKVSILDTDHLGAEKFVKDADYSRKWVWKSFARGHNPILMDALTIQDQEFDPNGAGFVAARVAMGQTRRFADRMALAEMTPRNDLASTKYCLANPAGGKAEYFVYAPDGGEFTVNLTAARGALAVEWFDPKTGNAQAGKNVAGGSPAPFTAPFTGDAVMYLRQ